MQLKFTDAVLTPIHRILTLTRFEIGKCAHAELLLVKQHSVYGFNIILKLTEVFVQLMSSLTANAGQQKLINYLI